MDPTAVPAPLRERLGPDATRSLLDLLDSEYQRRRADLITASTDRFDRRLIEETAALRVQIAGVEASIRQDMAQMGASIRQEMAEMGSSIRKDMLEMGASIRQDMAGMGATIRHEAATGRVELLRWCFLFWVWQVVTIAAIMGAMLRVMR
jgi:hypothetical protein